VEGWDCEGGVDGDVVEVVGVVREVVVNEGDEKGCCRCQLWSILEDELKKKRLDFYWFDGLMG
jgi:hypothetical protein